MQWKPFFFLFSFFHLLSWLRVFFFAIIVSPFASVVRKKVVFRFSWSSISSVVVVLFKKIIQILQIVFNLRSSLHSLWRKRVNKRPKWLEVYRFSLFQMVPEMRSLILSLKKKYLASFLPLKETKCGLLSNSLLAHAKYNTICSHKWRKTGLFVSWIVRIIYFILFFSWRPFV